MNTSAALLDVPISKEGTRVNGLERSVLVFRTTVNSGGQVEQLAPALTRLLGAARWSFDLDDRDRVLRIEQGAGMSGPVIDLLARSGFGCAELD